MTETNKIDRIIIIDIIPPVNDILYIIPLEYIFGAIPTY